VKLLERANGLERRHGRIAIGVLLVQDVLVAVVLTVLAGLGPVPEAPGRGGVVVGLQGAFGGMVLLVALAGVAVRWVLPAAAGWLAGSGEALFVAALTWCFGFILAAEALHVSTELGAFVAGVALAQLPEGRDLRRRVHPVVDLFVAVFFVSLGAGLDLRGAAALWPEALALSAVVLVAKPALVCVLLVWRGHEPRTAFLSGLTLGQISEFGFVLAALAVGAGLAEPTVLPLVGLVGLLTIGASALLVPAGERLYRAAAARLPGRLAPAAGAEPAAPGPRGHVVVVGMNDLGRRLARALSGRGESVVAVDTDPGKLSGLDVPAVVGDVSVTGVLEEAGVPRARLVVSALRIEDVNGLLAYRCRELGVPVAIHAFEPEQAEELLELGVDHVLVSKHEVARELAAALRGLGVAG
ncbi:MAG TPA: cation:proton antiporter, partial [Gemmatimonadota bacterium]|nr:cation:proton antiporter [Gemmatimonadota bacterium]